MSQLWHHCNNNYRFYVVFRVCALLTHVGNALAVLLHAQCAISK